MPCKYKKMKLKKMQGGKELLQREMEGKEKAVMTKHKWEEVCSGRELLKKKRNKTKQNKKAY